MNRRDMFLIGGSTAAAHVLYTGLAGCGAQSSGAAGSTTPTTGPSASLAEQANACALTCEECITASLRHIEGGMTDMLACVRLARECAVLCRAVASLAVSGSSRLHELAQICANCCDDCSAQCRSHAAHEAACAACADACAACATACRAA